MARIFPIAFVVAFGAAGAASATTINFEDVGATLGDGAQLTDAALAAYGVSIRLNDTDLAYVAKIGAPRTAFAGPGGADRVAAAYAEQIGSYFLSDDNKTGTPNGSTLSITYNSAYGSVGGDIIDVDFGENFLVQIYDAANNLLDSLVIDEASAGAGDGTAATFSFTRLTDDIAKLTITGSSSDYANYAVGYDNFTFDTVVAPAPVPVPLSGALLLGGLGVFGAMRLRRKA